MDPFSGQFKCRERFSKKLSYRPCAPQMLLLHAAPPKQIGTYHDAVVAELVDAQR
ncbi:hypothetical protein [Rhizobium lentis]|uniref:hypothetical protein n=1 Tax=Rhizobium lentis TaxID=1138194 RepID=UPI001C82A6FD|nr:hypothetical protein [Rhizobium lentis]